MEMWCKAAHMLHSLMVSLWGHNFCPRNVIWILINWIMCFLSQIKEIHVLVKHGWFVWYYCWIIKDIGTVPWIYLFFLIQLLQSQILMHVTNLSQYLSQLCVHIHGLGTTKKNNIYLIYQARTLIWIMIDSLKQRLVQILKDVNV